VKNRQNVGEFDAGAICAAALSEIFGGGEHQVRRAAELGFTTLHVAGVIVREGALQRSTQW
jgi:hypothetical protein